MPYPMRPGKNARKVLATLAAAYIIERGYPYLTLDGLMERANVAGRTSLQSALDSLIAAGYVDSDERTIYGTYDIEIEYCATADGLRVALGVLGHNVSA